MSLSPRLLARALELVEKHHGIARRGGRQPGWVEARLSEELPALSRATGESVEELLNALDREPSRRRELAELLRVGETRLYRDAEQWQALAGLLGQLPGTRRRGLSAGCSTGEEAFTLALVLAEVSPSRPFRVVGLDQSEAALAVARRARYPQESAREVPAELRARYFPPDGGDHVVVASSLAERTTFVIGDLLRGVPPGDFDVIACKNVLIYLTDEAGELVLAALSRALAPSGVLVVARSEVPRVRSFGLKAQELSPGVVVFRPAAFAGR